MDNAITMVRQRQRHTKRSEIQAAVDKRILDALVGPNMTDGTRVGPPPPCIVGGSCAAARRRCTCLRLSLARGAPPWCRDGLLRTCTSHGDLRAACCRLVTASTQSPASPTKSQGMRCSLVQGSAPAGGCRTIPSCASGQLEGPAQAGRAPHPACALQGSFRDLLKQGALEEREIEIDATPPRQPMNMEGSPQGMQVSHAHPCQASGACRLTSASCMCACCPCT